MQSVANVILTMAVMKYEQKYPCMKTKDEERKKIKLIMCTERQGQEQQQQKEVNTQKMWIVPELCCG